jgi:hypothetical protein
MILQKERFITRKRKNKLKIKFNHIFYVGPHSKNIDDGPIKMAPYEKKRKKKLTLTAPITN